MIEARKALIEASTATIESSTDPAIVFARNLLPTLREQRARIRVLNETLFQHRAKFARGLASWKGQTMYPDANFTLRVTYGSVAGYRDASGKPVPFTTKFADMFALSRSRNNQGEFAMPPALLEWRKKLGEATFTAKYANLPVNFVTTNDITGGNSGSATLNGRLAYRWPHFRLQRGGHGQRLGLQRSGRAGAQHRHSLRSHYCTRGARRRLDRRRARCAGPAHGRPELIDRRGRAIDFGFWILDFGLDEKRN